MSDFWDSYGALRISDLLNRSPYASDLVEDEEVMLTCNGCMVPLTAAACKFVVADTATTYACPNCGKVLIALVHEENHPGITIPGEPFDGIKLQVAVPASVMRINFMQAVTMDFYDKLPKLV